MSNQPRRTYNLLIKLHYYWDNWRCRQKLQDIAHLLLDCPASEPFRRAIFLALILFLISSPDLEAWFYCWASVKFLRASILRKGSDSTSTTIVMDVYRPLLLKLVWEATNGTYHLCLRIRLHLFIISINQ